MKQGNQGGSAGHGHKWAHFHAGKRAKGGKVDVVSGNKNVLSEAEDDKTGDEGRKRGGKVKRKKGGKVVAFAAGGTVRPRLDRPGRKAGGSVGANRSPLSTAHRASGGGVNDGGGPVNSSDIGANKRPISTAKKQAGAMSPGTEDTYGGTPKD